jgi:hypothetical protein
LASDVIERDHPQTHPPEEADMLDFACFTGDLRKWSKRL